MEPSRPYHHGNLRAALIDAGVELAREGGPEAVVLREVSRRAGVSHNAAYRHFADRDELLRAVCARCMSALARLMEARTAEVAAGPEELDAIRSRLRATGTAYIDFALTEPGWFRTAFAVPPGLHYLGEGEGEGEGDPEGEGTGAGASGLGPLELLSAQLDALSAAGALALERRPHAEIAAWSAVHGLAMLLLDGPLRELPAGERALASTRLLDTIERGL
jgi:AcrR family transcriptional regulator